MPELTVQTNNYICSLESQYVIDSMIELGHITPEIPCFLYQAGIDVDDLLDSTVGTNDQILFNLYKNWREQASQYERLKVTLYNMYDVRFLRDIINDMLHHVVEMYTGPRSDIFNSIIGSRFQEIKIENEDDIVSDKTIEELCNTEAFEKLENDCKSIIQRFENDMNGVDVNDFCNWLKNDIERSRSFEPIAVNFNEQNEIAPKKLPKKEIKRTRRALNKSIKLFNRMIGKDKFSAFIQGNGFTVEGKKYNYHVYKNSENIFSHTRKPKNMHIPYGLDVYDKNNIFLASSCVIFPDTPILDQIVAFKMHIDTDEDDMLNTMNLFNYSDAGINEFKTETTYESLVESYEEFDLQSLMGIDSERVQKIDNLVEKYRERFVSKILDRIDVDNVYLNFMYYNKTSLDYVLQHHHINNDSKMLINPKH